MSETPTVTGHAVIQSPLRYKANPIKEGFICAGIYTALAVILVGGIRLWAEHSKSETTGVMSAQDWAGFIGSAIGQFLLMAVILSSVIFYRRRKNVTLFILLDWRWWLVCLILSLLPTKPVLAWLWVGLVYQARLSKGN